MPKHAVSRTLGTSPLLTDLNPEQLRAVTHASGPLLIVAGAGTGKTTVITRRIAWFIMEQRVPTDGILALTFTEKAATEMEERIDRLLPYGYVDLWISTFHGFCDRILKRHALDIGIPNDYHLLDQTSAWLLLREHLNDLPLDYYRPRGNPTKFLHALLGHFSRCKDEAVTPAEYLAYAKELTLNADAESPDGAEAKRIEEIANVYHAYDQLLLKEGAMDFGDLLLRTLELFRSRPTILARYQKQFQHVLVDEFQDTNWTQYEIVKLLASSRNNLTVVGDDDQCFPTGTQITTPDGTMPIERVRAGMEVMTAVGKGYWCTSRVCSTSKHTINRTFITITTETGRRLTATANHKMFCAVPWLEVRDRRHHYVYLMWRNGLGWRIGVTNDIGQRLRLERGADCIVALRDFATDQEARYHEALWSLQYGIPMTCFKERDSVAIVGVWLKRLYRAIDSERGARALTRVLDVDIDAPQYTLAGVVRGGSRRVKVNVTLCVRRYGRKLREGARMTSPAILHEVHVETSDDRTVQRLRAAGFSLLRAKKGWRYRQSSTEMREIERVAQRLRHVTGGILEYSFWIARKERSVRAVMVPAGNLVRGLFVPVWDARGIRYERIVNIHRQRRRAVVYDFEVDRTHNYVANGVVVHNSIYRWRGAAMSNILHFKEDFPDAAQVAITINYRAKQNLLDASYACIRKNDPARLEVTLGLDKKLRAAQKGKGTVELFHAQDAAEEARMVIEKIMALRDAAGADWSWNNVAILVRANRQADQFLPLLNAAGIPYIFLASRGLYRKPIILDLLAYLKLLDDYHESTALYRVLNIPTFGFTYDELLTLTNWAGRKAQSLYTTLRNAAAVPGVEPKMVKKIQHALELLTKHADLARHAPVREVILAFFTDSGYIESITKEENSDDHESIGFLNQFWKRIEAFEESATAPTLRYFMEAIDLEREAGEEGALPMDPNAGPEAVRVLTVHAAKGLEFRYVFIVNLIEQRFPSTDRAEPIELPVALTKVIIPEGDVHLQEERRLFYVACTRAKEGLFLSYADDYGGTRTRKPSRFLTELGIPPSRHSEEVEKEREANCLASSPSRRARRCRGTRPSSTVYSDEESRKTVDGSNHVRSLAALGMTSRAVSPPTHAIPSRLSFTQLRAYMTCPWQYHYAHVLRIPLRGKWVFSFGQTMHLVLQRFFDLVLERNSVQQSDLFGITKSKIQNSKSETNPNTQIPKFEELIEMYETMWIDDWYMDAAQQRKYLEDGKRILKEFYAKHEREGWPIVRATEQPFVVKFDQYAVMGKADRIDVLSDGVEIIDYKTGKAKTKLETDDKMQLLIYQVAATQVLGVVPKLLSYYYLEDNSKQSFLGTDEEIANLHKKIVNVGQQIANGVFKENPGRHCTTCDFKDICPYAQT